MSLTWKAPPNVLDLLSGVKESNHTPRLEDAKITVVFKDSKPFIKNRFNWGSVAKFSPFSKLFQVPEKHDFYITLCSDVWHSILNNEQKAALLDLHLTRCELEYVPEVIIEGKKKKVVKDEWGRVKYTEEIKVDDEGNPKWLVAPLDLTVFSNNIKRYGLWCPELHDLQLAISQQNTDVKI